MFRNQAMKPTANYLFKNLVSARTPWGTAYKVVINTVRCATTRTGPKADIVFNKKLRIIHLDRSSSDKQAHVYDYVRDYMAKDLCDRVDDIKSDDKKRVVLNIGSCSGLTVKHLNPERIQTCIQADISSGSLMRARTLTQMLPPQFPVHYVQCDEEKLPFRPDSMNLVLSCLDLHWVNDLVSCFRSVNGILEDDSPFLGCLLGGDTLYELRSSLQLAETDRLGVAYQHMSPKTTGQDVANLLQNCGFQLITIDIAELRIYYPSMFELMFDLQGMGESNASVHGSKHLNKDVLQAASSIYQEMYGTDDLDQGIPATFQSIFFIGWKNPMRVKKEENK